ncbi:hypothetical protein TEGL_22080 [Terrisporobacter glycolicus ATCC 14880 = DSM 1288]|uniref:Uncharacterized protein n=2 Tax=Terrisporobacter glycolicus TaxID=36841 RepID=A0ABZ2EWC6_9FIRM
MVVTKLEYINIWRYSMKKFFFNSYNFLIIITGIVFITNFFLDKSNLQAIINVTALIILLIYAIIAIKVNK